MPITVSGRPARRTVEPITSGSPPYRSCHRSWASTTTWLAADSSTGPNKRPAAGLTPSTEKKSPVAQLTQVRSRRPRVSSSIIGVPS